MQRTTGSGAPPRSRLVSAGYDPDHNADPLVGLIDDAQQATPRLTCHGQSRGYLDCTFLGGVPMESKKRIRALLCVAIAGVALHVWTPDLTPGSTGCVLKRRLNAWVHPTANA